MKKLINKILLNFGQELKKVDKNIFQLSLYKKLFSKESLTSKRFYNVGAGNFHHPHWTNIDYLSDWYKDNSTFLNSGIHYDLLSLSPIPLEDEIAEIIYSSHTIEHIKDVHAQNLFTESYRILKKGGIIRLTAPDIDIHYAAYNNNDYDFFYWKDWYKEEKDFKKIGLNQPLSKASIGQLFLQRFAAATTTLHADGIKEKINDKKLTTLFNKLNYEDALNHCCNQCPIEIQKKYPGNHINWWNRKKVFDMLKIAGFTKIVISGYGQSQSPILRNTLLFDSTHPKISLYIEAIK